MCTIPLDLERRFERRWAARFSGALQEHHERQRQQTAPSKSKRKTRRHDRRGSVKRTAQGAEWGGLRGRAAPGRAQAGSAKPISHAVEAARNESRRVKSPI